MDVDAGPPRRAHALLPWLLIAAYGFAHLLWYWQTPFGQTAVLDERENLQLAEQIAHGTLPSEPFYRAMTYPAVLALFRLAGVANDAMPQVATAFGLLLHLACAALVARTAARWFAHPRAGLVAAIAYGFNPVLLHLATQILDGTLANLFFLVGCALLPVRAGENTWRRATLFSLAWSAAALTRPQFLPLFLFAAPLWWLVTRGTETSSEQPTARRAVALVCAALAGVSLWLVQAGANARVSGHAWLLPWQGAYNLWAANKSGANGAYYAQTIALEENAETGVHENPARWESLVLYRDATGRDGLDDIPAFNAYWRQRLREHIASRPGEWIALQFRKAYYLLNNAEQYNNKTYSFHRRESPWLRSNPIGWGLLLLGALGGAVALKKLDPRRAAALALAAGAIAGGIGLAYVSGRFRLPLVALLCVLCGGTVAHRRLWWPATRRQWLVAALLVAGAGLLAFSRAWGVADIKTEVQDRLLLARAANQTGHDVVAWREARFVLETYPQRRDALRLAVSSYHNLLVTGEARPEDEAVWRELGLRLLALADGDATREPQSPTIALALWRNDDADGRELWRACARAGNREALAALILTGEADADERATFARHHALASGPWQMLATARLSGNETAELAEIIARVFRKHPHE